MLTEYEMIIDQFEVRDVSLEFFSNEFFVQALNQRKLFSKEKVHCYLTK